MENEEGDITPEKDEVANDDNLENVETEEKSEEDTDALQEKNKNLFARAKKAETELKKLKAVKDDSSQSSEEAKDTSEYLTKDEAVLIAKGMELEDLDKLKLIQKGQGGTLKEAYDSDLYQSHIKQSEAENKRKKAQLGAEGGSIAKDEGFDKPNLTEAEHRALWKKHNE